MNNKLLKAVATEDFILTCLLILPIIIDIINGVISNYSNLEFSLGAMYRGFLLVLLFPFIIITKKTFLHVYIYLFLTLFAFCFIIWNFDSSWLIIKREFYIFAKIILPFFMLLYLFHYSNVRKLDIEKLMNYTLVAALFAGLSIILTRFLGIGVQTYGDYSFGTKGFFEAQNDIGLSLILSFVYCLYFVYSKKNNKKYILLASIIFVSLFCLGTRTGLLGSSLLLLIFSISIVFFDYSQVPIKPLTKALILSFILSFSVAFAFIMYIVIIDSSFLYEKFNALLEGTPRQSLEDAGVKRINSRGIIKNVFGEGRTSFSHYVGLSYASYKEFEVGKEVEQDILDMIGGYGLILGVLILCFPLTILIKSFYNFAKYRNFLTLTFAISALFFLTHSFLAGHAINSSTVSSFIITTYLAVLLNINSTKLANDEQNTT